MRTRWTVSLSLFLIIAVAGVAPFRAPTLVSVVDLGALILAFVVPAQWIGAPGDVWRRWPIVLGSIVAATMAWDAGTAALIGRRHFLADWPAVYGSSLAVFAGLLMLHGVLVAAWDRRRKSTGT